MIKLFSGLQNYLLRLSIILISFFIISLTIAQSTYYPQTQRYYLTGTLGEDAIQADITLTDGTLTGQYFYEDVYSGIDEILWLNGEFKLTGDDEINSQWTFTDSDTYSEGEEVGTFEGEFVNPHFHYDGPDSELDSPVFRGTWTATERLNQLPVELPFELVAVAEYIFVTMSNGVQLEMDTSYPYFFQEQWRGLNSFMADGISANIDFFQQGQLEALDYNLLGWELTSSQRIHYLSDDFVSIDDFGSMYMGGAHGIPGSHGRNFARLEEEWVEIELTDLFKENSDIAGVLNPFVMDELREAEAAWVMNGEITSIELEDLYSVVIKPAGFQITFDPYHMGPYAQGSIVVDVAFGDVIDIINEEGPLKAFFNSN